MPIRLAASKLGYVKISLTYHTEHPKHVRSLLLAGFGAFPPYHEDICILMPRMQVFTVLESFIPAFKVLQGAQLLHTGDKLMNFKILNEDSRTLAYVLG